MMSEFTVTIDHQGRVTVSVSAATPLELTTFIASLLPIRAQLLTALGTPPPGAELALPKEEKKSPVSIPVPAPVSSLDHFCPEHNMPFHQYKFGWAHPPLQPGGKWCREEKSK